MTELHNRKLLFFLFLSHYGLIERSHPPSLTHPPSPPNGLICFLLFRTERWAQNFNYFSFSRFVFHPIRIGLVELELEFRYSYYDAPLCETWNGIDSWSANELELIESTIFYLSIHSLHRRSPFAVRRKCFAFYFLLFPVFFVSFTFSIRHCDEYWFQCDQFSIINNCVGVGGIRRLRR